MEKTKERLEAERLIKMFSKGIKEKAVISNSVKFAAIKCAIIHVNGLIKDNENTLRWLKDQKAGDNLIHGITRNVDYHNSIKYILENDFYPWM